MNLLTKPSEYIMLVGGVIILVSILIISDGGNFIFWTTAKGLYVLGVIFMVFGK